MRRLGVDLSAAAVEQELFNQGIQKSQNEVTQAEKIMARYAIIMRQTADAQGDAERTSDGLANMQRRLKGILLDVRVEIGKHLLPKITEMAQEFAEFAKTQEFEDTIEDIGEAAGTTAELLKGLIDTVRTLADLGQPLADFFNWTQADGPDPERLRAVADGLEAVERFLTFDLGRAAGGGQTALAGRLGLRELADEIEAAAQKVHESKSDFDLSGVLSEADAKIAELTADQMKRIGVETEEAAQVSKEALAEAEAAAKKYQQRIEDLRSEIDPVGTRIREIKQEQEFLNEAWHRGDIDVREYALGVQLYREELEELNPQFEILQRHLENLPKGVPLKTEGIDEMAEEISIVVARQEEARRKQEEWRQEVHRTIDDWRDLGHAIGDIFGRIDSDLGDAIHQVTELIATVQHLRVEWENMSKVQRAAAGAQVGAQTSNMLISQGVFKGSQTQGSFGGRGERDYADIGGQIGGVLGSFFGPVGTLIGALLGSVIGGAIKRGADEGLAGLELVGDEVVTMIEKDERGLGKVIGGIGDTIGDTVENIVTTLGGTLAGLPEIDLKVRGDEIRARIDGVLFTFKEAAEAVDVLSREILSRADIAGDIDEAFRQLLSAGAAGDVEELTGFITVIDQALNAEKKFILGMSDIEIALSSSQVKIAQWTEQFMDMGLTADQAIRLAGANSVAFFTQMREAITGEQQSVEQRKATQRAQAELFNAQLQLEIARLEAEREVLMAKQGLSAGEIQIELAKIEAGKKFVQAQGKLLSANTEIQKGFVQASSAIMSVAASTINKQIEAISKVIEALKKIGLIDIGKLRLPNLPRIGGDIGNLGGNIGDLGDAGRDAAAELERAVESLRATIESLRTFRMDLLGGETQPVRNQLLVAQREAARAFQRARANGGNQELVDEFIAAQRRLLDVGRGAFGSGAGFQHFLSQVLGRTEDLEALFGQKLDELLAPPAEQTAENTAQLVEHQQKIEEHTRNVAQDSRRNAEISGRIEGETRRSSTENQLGHGKTRVAISDLDTHLRDRFESLERALERALSRVA